MKYLLLLLGVGLVVWQWRRHRRQQHITQNHAHSTVKMVACSHCGVHVPAAEAVSGQNGSYCNETHRRSAEG